MSKEGQLEAKPRRVRLAFGVLFSTENAVSDVEDWLENYCDGQWNLAIDGMDDALIKKSLKITFELEADKHYFINEYARG